MLNIFSILPLHKESGPNSLQHFAENYMNLPELHRNLMFGNPHSMGKGIQPYH